MFPLHLAVLLLAVSLQAPIQEEGTRHQQWRVSEFSFTAASDLGDPLDVPFEAMFWGPGGESLRVPGFWDGGDTWRVRFAPTQPGRWTYRTLCRPFESVPRRVLHESGLVRGGEPAARVDVDVSGATRLILTVTDGGDGIGWDHADWAEAVVIGTDASVTRLQDLAPERATQGYRSLALGANLLSEPLSIGGSVFAHGLGTSGDSEIVYSLPPSAARFQAWTGMDDVVGDHGTVTFRVVAEYAPKALGRDSGLHGRRGAFIAAPATGPSPLYRHGGFLRVSPDRRYLTCADGTPFFWLADTWWFCPSDLLPFERSSNPAIPSAFRHLIDTRVRQGYTAAIFGFLGAIDGCAPPQSFHAHREIQLPYWREVDRCVAYSCEAGLMPLVSLMAQYEVLGNSQEDWAKVWRYFIARYAAYPVGWMVCAEYNLPDEIREGATGFDERLRTNLTAGQTIRALDPYKRAMTIFPWVMPGDGRQAWDEPWYDFITFQGGHGPLTNEVFDTVLRAYRGDPAEAGHLTHDITGAFPAGGDKPVLLQETTFEGIQTQVMRAQGHPPHDAGTVREAAYRGIQNGSFGFTYGAQGLWYPNQSAEDRTSEEDWGPTRPWWEALEFPGAAQLGHLRRIYEHVPWWRLEPRTGALTDGVEEGTEVLVDFLDRMGEARIEGGGQCKATGLGGLTSAAQLEIVPPGEGELSIVFEEVPLPAVADGEAIRLVLAAGLADFVRLDDPDYPADGVNLAIDVDGQCVWSGDCVTVGAEYRAVDLTAFAGGAVTVTFRASCRRDLNWDHARLRRPLLVRTVHVEPLRSRYEPPAERLRIDVKADGDDVVVIYFPAGSPRWRLRLLGARSGARYRATWHDPRTGAASPATMLAPAGAEGIALPVPPSEQDWVLILRRDVPPPP